MIDCSCGSCVMQNEKKKIHGESWWQVRCLRCNATAPPGGNPHESAKNWDRVMAKKRTIWTADILYRDGTNFKIDDGNIESIEC